MRFLMAIIVPFVLWLGVLQVPLRPLEPHPPDSIGSLLSMAAALTGLTVAVYRLGIWREQMNNTKSSVTAELARHREESAHHFVAIERRLTSIEEYMRQYVSDGVEHRALLERWQGRVDTTLETHGRRIDALDSGRSHEEVDGAVDEIERGARHAGVIGNGLTYQTLPAPGGFDKPQPACAYDPGRHSAPVPSASRRSRRNWSGSSSQSTCPAFSITARRAFGTSFIQRRARCRP